MEKKSVNIFKLKKNKTQAYHVKAKNQVNAKQLSSSTQGVYPMAKKHCHLPRRLFHQERLSLLLSLLYRDNISHHFNNLQWNGHTGQ